MPQSAEQVEARLRERGFALTPQRRAIVRHLVDNGGHWTAGELLAGITGEFPTASRATVYTTLALLKDLGVVMELPSPGGEVRYDANTDPHQHFVCRRCGRLEDVPDAWLPVRLAAEAPVDFRVERFRVIAEGLCAACA